jgi:hypothetical protein
MSIPSNSLRLQSLYNQFYNSPTIDQATFNILSAGTNGVFTSFTYSVVDSSAIFTRAYTTVPAQNGAYIIGSTLSSSSPAYTALNSDNNYYGIEINLYGKMYEVYYWVIESGVSYGFVGNPL